MQPTSPVLPNHKEVVYAKDQDQSEYNPLPAIRSEDGKVLTRWTLTEEERKAIAEGADILLTLQYIQSVHTTYIYMEVEGSRTTGEISDWMGLLNKEVS